MTISATNQGLRPGVCLSTSRPTTPFAGMLIFETDTSRLAVWNGTAWVVLADSDTPPGLQLIKTQTIGSAVSSVTVSDVFSSEFDNYKIIVSGGVGSTAQQINLTLGASTANYYSSLLNLNYGADTLGYVRSNNAASWAAGVSYVDGNTLDVVIFRPFETALTGLSIAGGPDYRTTGAARIGGGGFHNVSASYTAFTLTVTGTMTGGTIRVYGYRNS